jgi:hypothetical protein
MLSYRHKRITSILRSFAHLSLLSFVLLLPTPLHADLKVRPAEPIKLDIAQIVTPIPKHNYDKEVLAPLRALQAVAKAKADKEAQDELARQQALLAQAYTPANAPVVSYDEPADGYKAFIYNHESGNDPTRWNGSGCLGLGQACPASKLLAVCPDMSYACEDQFFTNYANARYGSWAGAYAFWVAHRWW